MNKLQLGVQSIVIILVIMVSVGSSVQSQLSAASVSNAIISDERYVGQKTEMSNPASPTVTPHGKVPHQIVFALPLRNDSKIWTGTVTFTSSKPIEIEVLHGYKPEVLWFFTKQVASHLPLLTLLIPLQGHQIIKKSLDKITSPFE